MKTKNPKSLFFFDCEKLFEAKNLEEIIEEYSNLLQIFEIKETCFVFLDEITSIPKWSKAIKFLIDQNRFKNMILIISGSNAVDLKKGADRLPGRKGKGKEISFLPLSFSEFLSVTEKNKGFHKTEEKELSIKYFFEGSKKNLASLTYLSQKLDSYLLTGGFPRLINEFASASSILHNTYEDYLSWMRGEVARQKKEEKKALQLLAELAVVLGSKIGWDTLAKKMGNISHHTVEDYAELFDLLFIGKPLYQIDLSKKRINWRKSKKFYFIDSLIYFLAIAINEKWSNIFDRSIETLAQPQRKSYFIEQMVFNHLIRLSRDWLNPNNFF